MTIVCSICENTDADFGFDVLLDEGNNQVVGCRNCEARMFVEWRGRKARVIGLPYAEGLQPDPDTLIAAMVEDRKEQKLALGAKLRRTPHPGPKAAMPPSAASVKLASPMTLKTAKAIRAVLMVVGAAATLTLAVVLARVGHPILAAAVLVVGIPAVYFLIDVLCGAFLPPLLTDAVMKHVAPQIRSSSPSDTGDGFAAALHRGAAEETLRKARDATSQVPLPVPQRVENAARRYAGKFPEEEQRVIGSCVLIGYLWRRAEQQTIPDSLGFAAIARDVEQDARRGTDAAFIGMREEDRLEVAGYWVLFCAARARTQSAVPPEQGALGQRESGSTTIRSAFEDLTAYLPAGGADRRARELAFVFGVNIADVKRYLDDEPELYGRPDIR